MAKIKTPKLLKIPKKGVTNLHKQKLKKLFAMSTLEFFAKLHALYMEKKKKNNNSKGGEEERNNIVI